MAEYIDLDKKITVVDTQGRKLETTVRHILDFNNGEYEADDAQLARHGRWEINNDGIMIWWECSECHHNAWYDGDDLYNYCPNCGAKMDGGET